MHCLSGHNPIQIDCRDLSNPRKQCRLIFHNHFPLDNSYDYDADCTVGSVRLYHSSDKLRGEQLTGEVLRIHQKAKKAAVLALLCFVSDLLLILVRTLLHEDNATIVASTYSVNLIINQLATLACFDHSKHLLWPWSKKHCENAFSDVFSPAQLRPTKSSTFSVPKHTSIREIRSSAT